MLISSSAAEVRCQDLLLTDSEMPLVLCSTKIVIDDRGGLITHTRLIESYLQVFAPRNGRVDS